jgi:hypothetical protein
MTWSDQDPPATDALLHLNVPCSGGGTPARLELDKLPNGSERATVGTLFEHQEICRTGDLEALVRQANAMAACRSFDDDVRAPGDADARRGQPQAMRASPAPAARLSTSDGSERGRC